MKECLSCKTIFPSHLDKCESCGSMAVVSIGKDAPQGERNTAMLILLGCIVMAITAVFLSSSTSSVAIESTPARGGITYSSPRSVEAETLYSEFEENELSAESKYKGEKVAVSGIIVSVSKDITGSPYVILGAKKHSVIGIQCVFDRSRKSDLLSLRKGERATFTCEVRGKLVHVQLSDCQ